MANFIQTMYECHYQLHDPQGYDLYNKLYNGYDQSSGQSYDSLQDGCGSLLNLNGYINLIPQDALKPIHRATQHTGFIAPSRMNIGEIGHMMNRSDFKKYSWFKNDKELNNVMKKVKFIHHPDKFSDPEENLIETKRFQGLREVEENFKYMSIPLNT